MTTQQIKAKINDLENRLAAEKAASGYTKEAVFIEACIKTYKDKLSKKQPTRPTAAKIEKIKTDLAAEVKANGLTKRALFLAATVAGYEREALEN